MSMGDALPLERATYIRENTESGIVVLQTHDDGDYRVTEKRDGDWCTKFWMPADEMREFLQSDDTEIAGTLSDEQLDVLSLKASA